MRYPWATLEVTTADGGEIADPPSLAELLMPFARALVPDEIRETITRENVRVMVFQEPVHGREQPFTLAMSRLEYRSPEWGYVYVRIVVDDETVYRHLHTIEESFDAGLAEWLASREDDEEAGLPAACHLAIDDDALELNTRPAPEVEGATELGPGPRKARFRIRAVPEPPPPAVALDVFGEPTALPADNDVGEPTSGGVHVLVTESVARELLEAHAFSDEVEEGGFLIGNVYRVPGDAESEPASGSGDSPDPASPDTDAASDSGDRFVAVVTGAVPAEHTGASLLHFAFTGDSFAAVKRKLDADGSRERLLGWYHTHLFAASRSCGLSSIDLRLHFTTFRIPWQLAGLVNLSPKSNTRVLRFYVRQGDDMVRCPQQIITDEAAAEARVVNPPTSEQGELS